MALIRGTTPTIKFTFSSVDPTDIQVAYLFVKQYDGPVIERDFNSATVEGNSISWVLEQEETLRLKEKSNAKIFCDWRLVDGLRGRSNIVSVSVESSGKNEVI